MMGAWTETVEAKARVIHGQISAARALADRIGEDPNKVDGPYLDLLSKLYRDEYLFAQLVDDSDLVVRFEGPAVLAKVPTISLVASMCTALRKHVREVVKSIVGLAADERVRWPAGLDPQLSGMAPGSLVVGVCIQGESESVEHQPMLPEVSRPVLEAVKGAVRSIAAITRHVHDDGIDDGINEDCPDPAVRDTVVVAASKLAPTGRAGIDRLSLYGPDATGREATPLTRKSRQVLKNAIRQPVRVTGRGSFRGVVRAIDLDARRFEIRRVDSIGAIRCIFGSDRDAQAREILDTEVVVTGEYEAQSDRKPRLIQVSSLDVVDRPTQLSIDDAEEQRRLQAQVAPLIGSISGSDPNRAEEVSQRVRDILAKKYPRD